MAASNSRPASCPVQTPKERECPSTYGPSKSLTVSHWVACFSGHITEMGKETHPLAWVWSPGFPGFRVRVNLPAAGEGGAGRNLGVDGRK